MKVSSMSPLQCRCMSAFNFIILKPLQTYLKLMKNAFIMIIGLVGKPSSGKSTFFKALTLAEVAIAPYPFTTIKPNEGVGFVKVECVEKFFNVKCNPREGYCVNGWRFVPAKLMDVAGLVPGAHLGKGLGLSFLDDLRQADALIQIVDASGSTNEKGELVEEGSYDPCSDVEWLERELDMWFLSILKKGWERFARTVQQTNADIKAELAKQLSGLNVREDYVKYAINSLKLAEKAATEWNDGELLLLATMLRKRSKPMIIAANKADTKHAEENIKRLQQKFPDRIVMPCSAEAELALREAAKKGLVDYIPGEVSFKQLQQLNEKQEKALVFVQDAVLKKYGSSGVQQCLDAAVFKLLNYIAVFPGGVHKLTDQFGRVLPDCFLMPPNSTSLDFAYKLHTDFGKNFVNAIDVKTKKAIGREHLLKHLDVVEVKTR